MVLSVLWTKGGFENEQEKMGTVWGGNEGQLGTRSVEDGEIEGSIPCQECGNCVLTAVQVI